MRACVCACMCTCVCVCLQKFVLTVFYSLVCSNLKKWHIIEYIIIIITNMYVKQVRMWGQLSEQHHSAVPVTSLPRRSTFCPRRIICWDLPSGKAASSFLSLLLLFCVVSNFNIMKTLTLLVLAGLFQCFHNPPNSDVDYRIFNMHIFVIFLPAYTHGGPWFIVSSEGLFSCKLSHLSR